MEFHPVQGLCLGCGTAAVALSLETFSTLAKQASPREGSLTPKSRTGGESRAACPQGPLATCEWTPFPPSGGLSAKRPPSPEPAGPPAPSEGLAPPSCPVGVPQGWWPKGTPSSPARLGFEALSSAGPDWGRWAVGPLTEVGATHRPPTPELHRQARALAQLWVRRAGGGL